MYKIFYHSGALMTLAVIIPTYNREEFIGRAIISVQRQKLDLPLKIIVVDDGSTDNTLEFLEKIANKDKRITIIYQENKGVSSARNRGINSLSQNTEYVTFLDSDDLMTGDRFSLPINSLKHNPTIDYVIGEVLLIRDFMIDELNPTALKNMLISRVSTHSVSSAIFRRDVFDKIGLFNENLRKAEDLDFFLRLAEAGIAFKQLDQPCIYYTRHDKDHLTKDLKSVAKSTAKAIAMSVARRKNNPSTLLMPKFNIDSLRESKKSN